MTFEIFGCIGINMANKIGGAKSTMGIRHFNL